MEYLGQQTQGSAVRYGESSLKKKRVYWDLNNHSCLRVWRQAFRTSAIYCCLNFRQIILLSVWVMNIPRGTTLCNRQICQGNGRYCYEVSHFWVVWLAFWKDGMVFPLSSATGTNSGLKLTKQINLVSFGSLPVESNKNTVEGTLILSLVLRLRKLKDEVLIVIFSYFFNSECEVFFSLTFSRIKSSAVTAFIFLIFPLNPGMELYQMYYQSLCDVLNKCLLKVRCYTVCCLAILNSIWLGDTWTMK